jgi:hypothetical protein
MGLFLPKFLVKKIRNFSSVNACIQNSINFRSWFACVNNPINSRCIIKILHNEQVWWQDPNRWRLENKKWKKTNEWSPSKSKGVKVGESKMVESKWTTIRCSIKSVNTNETTSNLETLAKLLLPPILKLWF